MTLREVQQQDDVEVPAVLHWETSHEVPQKPKNKNKIEDTELAQGDLLRDLPERSEELTENLEDEGMIASGCIAVVCSAATWPRHAVNKEAVVWFGLARSMHGVM